MESRNVLLITDSTVKKKIEDLSAYAEVYWLDELSARDLNDVLPRVTALFVVRFWPPRLNHVALAKMTRLRFVQSFFAGVNHIPFNLLPENTTVSSNAGAFSQEVAEHAWGLLIAAAKRIVPLDRFVRKGTFTPSDLPAIGRDTLVLEGKTLGILGFGGIGQAVAKMGRAFGMRIVAYTRPGQIFKRVDTFHGGGELHQMLRICDAVVIALPLSNQTANLLAAPELAAMKPNAILVNVARAEIVQETDLYDHLQQNPQFTYATDVWRVEHGAETFSMKLPFLSLDNFIGTPHVAGWAALMTLRPLHLATQNLIRFLTGQVPGHVVDHEEYLFAERNLLVAS